MRNKECMYKDDIFEFVAEYIRDEKISRLEQDETKEVPLGRN